jgi:hypothetical protein
MSSSSPAESAPVHPAVRSALRVSFCVDEYRLFYELVIKRCPPVIRERIPSPAEFETIANSKTSCNEAAVRSSLRVFLVIGLGSKVFNSIAKRALRKPSLCASCSSMSIHCSYMVASANGILCRRKSSTPDFRLALAVALVLYLHRTLYRFFVRLRVSLRSEDAQPFRRRNPRTSSVLTSRYAPAIGASVAGFALGACPQYQLRMTLAIYTSTRSLEFLYHILDEGGWFSRKQWWFGSWLLMPVSCAQLFHAFVFDRETTPKVSGQTSLSHHGC